MRTFLVTLAALLGWGFPLAASPVAASPVAASPVAASVPGATPPQPRARRAWRPPRVERTAHFEFRYSDEAAEDALRLARRAEEIRARIVGDLGRGPEKPTTVVVTADAREFQRAQPGGRRMPGWVAGVAYSRQNLIILGPAPRGGNPHLREVLLAHEYSHVALAHAVRFRRLPPWFVEGFADLQAMAPYLGDWRAWGGHGGAQPLEELHRNLGHDHRKASRSYRQSYDFVRYLRDQGDVATFRRLIDQLAAGREFNAALQETYQLTTGEMEGQWRKRWNWRNVIVPMMTSGLVLWVLAALLVVVAFVRKRRERRAAIAAMEGDEEPGSFSRGSPWVHGDQEGGGWEAGAGPFVHGGPGPSGALVPGEGAAPPGGTATMAGGGGGGDHPRETVPLLNVGVLMVATLIAVTLTALLALIWPHTRLWILAGPAVVITLLALRWASR